MDYIIEEKTVVEDPTNIKEYDLYEAKTVESVDGKEVVIKQKVDTVTKENLLRNKEHLQAQMDIIDAKLSAIDNIVEVIK